uniref:Uncharacterized protein n=1 Tax=Anguilla anguilla TaxID=7936 RepID=A0A0E9RZ45_ANGAN
MSQDTNSGKINLHSKYKHQTNKFQTSISMY